LRERFFNEEIYDLIDKYKDKENPIEKYQCLLLREPYDEEKFCNYLDGDRIIRETGLVEKNFASYDTFWNNNISSMDDVMNMIDQVFEKERKKHINLIKCSTNPGIIMEDVKKKKNDDDDDVYDDDDVDCTYGVFNPNEVSNANILTVDLNNEEAISHYKEYVIAKLRELNDNSNHISSSTVYIAIHKIQICCYFLAEFGH
jgi:hypothetical protein